MVENIEVKKILPDENQPRKYFDAGKMFNLKNSIKKHGIKVPVTVEDMGNGKYLLIDGERRFRSAIELGLKSIPAVIEAPKTEAERLIEQFSIQEQHAEWTPVEKAMAILNLSKIVSKALMEVCQMLDIDRRTSARYIAFAELADKESFVKNEMPLEYALYVRSLKSVTKHISETQLEKEFNRSDEKKLEHQLTKLIVRGDVRNSTDIVRLTDSFKKNPNLIEKFLTKDNVTPASLFLEAKAQGAYHLRNAISSARQITSHARGFLKVKDVKIDVNQLEILSRARKDLGDLIDLVD